MTVKEQQSRRTRQRLTNAAARLFAQHGYRDTSVQAIGEAAGVSRGSVFWHFGSKQGLLAEVVEQAFGQWERADLVADVGEAVGLEAIRRAVESHRRFLSEHGRVIRLFYVLMFEALGPKPELAPTFAHVHAGLRNLGARWISRGIAAGEIRADLQPEAAASVIIGALGGVVYQWLLDPQGVKLDPIYANLAATLERGLTPVDADP